MQRITVLSGGVGGARFLRGLRHGVRHGALAGAGVAPDATITAVVNTADDWWVHGVKVCPDLDTVMYTLGGGIDEERGWGRREETWHAGEELAAYGVEPTWFGLGDRDLGTHLVRTQMLEAGYPLSQVTAALCRRWQPGVEIVPMSDDRVETHVAIPDPDSPSGRRVVHFQEYWVRLRAAVPAEAIVVVGVDEATAAPGVVDAITRADVVILPPSNPVVSVGTILGVSEIRAALAETSAPVVGLSPSSPATTCAAWPSSCWPRWASRCRPPGSPSTTGRGPAAGCSTGGWSTRATPGSSRAWRRRGCGRPPCPC
ncbi:MAG: 2-phospho-L-lactate transferase [Nocardioides sp.]